MIIGTAGLVFTRLLTCTTFLAGESARQRSWTLEAARLRHPARFATTTHDPKILELSTAAWINQPNEQDPRPKDHSE